jgi:membrane-bound lytic murein transglycosylase D
VVIAAYNCGPGNINKAVRRSGGKQSYWEIYSKLPRETRGYIPIFIAANYVMNYTKEHHLSAVQPTFKLLTDTIILTSYLNFAQISAVLNIPVEEIRQLNPQYKRDIIPAKTDKQFVLKLPIDKISPFIDNQTQILAYEREKYFPNNQIVLVRDDRSNTSSQYGTAGKKEIFYIVKSGDTPGGIASKFRVSTSNLIEWNNIRHNRINIGQQLAIYVSPKSVAATENTTKEKPVASTNLEAPVQSSSKPIESISGVNTLNDQYTYYTVRSGDSLYTIAKQFAGVSDTEIKLLNNIKNARGLVIGQKLKIPVKA